MPQQTGLFHNVFFWLREDGEETDSSFLAKGCISHLTGIPGIVRLTVGMPAAIKREVVESSYDLALLIEFSDMAAHDAYQSNPDHLRFVDECGKYWSRARIFDTVPFSG